MFKTRKENPQKSARNLGCHIYKNEGHIHPQGFADTLKPYSFTESNEIA